NAKKPPSRIPKGSGTGACVCSGLPRSAHHVDVDVDGSVDDRLGVGLVEQVHQDLAVLQGDAGIGGQGIAVDELAVGGGDVQQGAVGDDVRVHSHGAITQAQPGRAAACPGVIA